jgi:putative ABC transport system substrate-binding protein
MRRREFLGILGSAAATWPFTARAQQSRKVPTIGFLSPSTTAAENPRTAAFVQQMRELGWIEGRNVVIEHRAAEGRGERAAEIAAEFVRLKVDVIVTAGAASIIAAKQATQVIPIVFAAAGDPVATGLVGSLSRPGGNVTGLSILAPDLVGKRIELLREVVPGLRRLAVMVNASNPTDVLQMEEAREAARIIGLDAVSAEIRRAEDIGPAFETLRGRVDALYVSGDPLMVGNRVRINTLVQNARLPTVYNAREFVEAGGLMCYGPNFPDLYRRAAGYVDKILRGAKPANLPVEQPTKFDLVLNLTTAKVLGITMPPTVLTRASELIE